ncbi:hypothetical protein [Myxacorys almedinensis]|uniref:Uncharacterized protein n=1 Tax=Myxacorys almedinensis A TaxID=2690445 RepID=A0A8J8CIW8_9CYAN|nr:hypothetical protein [Myxacorys almedinensis]NDJ18378.1 hypothetical protein [Myxacorys almedinensis A]
MTSLTEIEAAILQLPKDEAHELLHWLQNYLETANGNLGKKLSLSEAVEVMRHLYESGGELAAISAERNSVGTADSDTDDFYKYEDYA